MDIFNAKWITSDSIEYEYEHPEYGLIPSTCAAWDIASSAIFDELSAQLGPFVAPEPEDAPSDEELLARLPAVSHAQIIAALVISEIITEAEGISWITGTLPETVELMIASLPPEQQIIARLRAIRPTTVVPTDPLVTALGIIKGKTTTDMIELFELAASL